MAVRVDENVRRRPRALRHTKVVSAPCSCEKCFRRDTLVDQAKTTALSSFAMALVAVTVVVSLILEGYVLSSFPLIVAAAVLLILARKSYENVTLLRQAVIPHPYPSSLATVIEAAGPRNWFVIDPFFPVEDHLGYM